MAGVVGVGGTISLDVKFRDGSGALVDPVTPLVDIVNPSAVEVITNATPTRDGVGQYHYDHMVGLSDPLGTWTAHWTGVINGAPVAGDDTFVVVAAGTITITGEPYAPISALRMPPFSVPLEELDDDLATVFLLAASNKVDSYTGTTFAALPSTITVPIHDYPLVPLPLPYDDITAVSLDGDVLEDGSWTEEPWGLRLGNCPPDYLPTILDPWASWNFLYGYYGSRALYAPHHTDVSGTFGYATPTQDVIDATALLAVRRFRTNRNKLGPSTIGGVSSESMQAFARSWFNQSAADRKLVLDTTGDLEVDALLEQYRARPRSHVR